MNEEGDVLSNKLRYSDSRQTHFIDIKLQIRVIDSLKSMHVYQYIDFKYDNVGFK